MYHTVINPAHATPLVGIALDRPTPQTPFALTPVVHPQHGLASPESRTFWTATANALYIVRRDDHDLFGPTPGFANKLIDCPDLVDHGRRGPLGCDADRIAGLKLWRAADDAAIRDRPTSPVAWHAIGWLPLNQDAAQWRALVLQFLDDHIVRDGMIADFAIHALPDGDGGWIKRPHFHAVLTARFWRDGDRTGQPQPTWLSSTRRCSALMHAWAALIAQPG